MRTIAAADEAIYSAESLSRHAKVRVSVKNASGTFKDMTSFPEDDFVLSAQWQDDVDSVGQTATVALLRNIGNRSLAPLHETSPLNKNFTPATAFSALVAVGREVKIEAALLPPFADSTSYVESWNEVFRGYIDTVDWAGDEMQLACSDLSAKLRDTYIETQRTYAFAQGGSALKGCRIFEASTAYVLNELVVPTQANINAHFYGVTVAGTTAATEPVWPTGGASTVTSGGATFTERGATSTTAGTAVETVMQQIIDDTLGAGTVTLNTPVSPAWSIRFYEQQRESILDAVSRLAEQIGWTCRYKWDSGSSTFKLTLSTPNRASTTAVRTIASTETLTVDRCAVEVFGIRNAVRVIFPNYAARDPSGYSPRVVVERTDATSITAYGRRFMEVAEASNSNIDTSTEATLYADAMLADLKDPLAEYGVELLPFFHFEVSDILQFTANNLHFTSDQKLAIVSIAHSVSGDECRTRITTRGKPSTGFARHLRKDVRVADEGQHRIQLMLDGSVSGLAVSDGVAGGTATGIVGGVRIDTGYTATLGTVPIETELHISESASFTPSVATMFAVGPEPQREVSNLIPGRTYYVKTVPYAFNAGRKVRGLPSVEQSFVAGRARAIHYDTGALQNLMPLNGNFEHASRDLALYPPDHWEIGAGQSWGSGGSAFYGTDTDYGRTLKLNAHASLDGTVVSSPFAVRRGGTGLTIRVSHKRTVGSGASTTYSLSVRINTFKEFELTTLVDALDFTISGDSSVYALNTWFTSSHVLGSAISSPANFATVEVYRTGGGSTLVAHEVGDVYVTDEMFFNPRADVFIGVLKADLITNPSMSNSWVDYNSGTHESFGYHKTKVGRSDGVQEEVRLHGVIKSGTVAATIYTLPSGCRPSKICIFGVGTDTGIGQLEVDSSGNVTLQTGGNGWVALSGVVFTTG